MSRYCRDQRSPDPRRGTLRQPEPLGVDVEQPKPASAMVEGDSQVRRIVGEPAELLVKLPMLHLKPLGELPNVMKTDQESHQAYGLRSGPTEQARQPVAQGLLLRQKGFGGRGHIEAVERQRVPGSSAIGCQGPAFPQKRRTSKSEDGIIDSLAYGSRDPYERLSG